MRTGLITISVAISLLPLAGPARAGSPVYVSFLTERAAVRDTLQVLRNGGCTEEAASTFQRVVERYSSSGFAFDLSKFPKPRDGVYRFESASKLVAALPHKLCDTEHAYELNCFDTVFGMAGKSLRVGIRPNELAGPYLVPHTPTKGSLTLVPRATARDAFTLAYPSWYREVTENELPDWMAEARICLTAALFRAHMLPQSTTEDKLARGVMDGLKACWRREGMVFPGRFEMVLCHEVSLPQRWFVTAHAGLLFPRKRGYTYIEKSGGSGPFVRLDVEDRAALLTWFGGMFRGAQSLGYTHHFATFNDDAIERIDFRREN
jgi:hypothetical protein